jgi:hypothetical protein
MGSGKAAVYLACALLACAAARAQTGKPLSSATAEWAVEFGEGGVGPPVQVGGTDAVDGIAVTLRSGKIVVVSPTGERLREMQLDLAPGAAPIAGEATNSGRDILAADVSGSVYCFTPEGARRWKYTRSDRFGSGFNYLVLADLDGDGHPEVLVTTERGNLYAVDRHGRLRFDLHATNFRLSTPAVGDVNGDGIPEIVFADDDGGVYCVNGRGETLWLNRLHNGRFGRTLPLIADADGDGRYEVYIPINSSDLGPGMYALDGATGKVLFRVPTAMQTYNSTVVADLDGRGRKQILLGDKSSVVYAMDPGGRRLWERQIGGRGIFRAAAVADLDGSGRASIFQVVRDSGLNGQSLYTLDPAGNVLDSIPLPGGGSFSPLLCRFRGQTDVKLVVAGAKGRLVCYRLPQRAGGARILWPGTRNDSEFSGFVRSEKSTTTRQTSASESVSAAVERRAALRGRNVVSLAERPAGSIVAFRLRDPDGVVHLQFLMPGEETTQFATAAPGDYEGVARWLAPDSGATLGGRSFHYTLDAAGSEDARRLAGFEKEVSALRGQLGRHAVLAEYFTALARTFREQKREERTYWLALLQYVAKAHPARSLTAAQIENPWADFDAGAFFRHARQVPGGVSVSMLGNEYESAALAITNLSPSDVTARLEVGPFAHGALELRDVPLILVNSTGRPAEDPLPLLGEGNLLRLHAGETRKIWLTFCSRDLAAGTHRVRLRIGDLLSQESPIEIPIEVRVHPVRLPDKRVYHHENWLTIGSIADEDLREKTIRDALAHGTNVFLIPAVTIAVSKDGKLGQADTALHDRLVNRLRGKAVFLVTGGTVNLRWPEGFKPDARAADAAFVDAIRWYDSHMQSLGIQREDWAFYILDEPGLTGDDAKFQWWTEQVHKVKAADANVQVYANPAGGARPDMLARVAGLIDIWQPDLALLRGDEQHLGPIFRAGQYWHYEPPGEQRELNPLGYYRMKPWVAYRLGMTGGGYWVYSWSDYWFWDSTMGAEFGTVYPTANGPVTTKRWEASRDGAEDFELLWMIREEARKQGGARGADALRLIDEAVQFVTAGQDKVGDISRKLHPYTPDYARWMDYRRRLIELAERLAQ